MKNVFFQRTSENTVFWNFGKNQLSISIMKPELSIITATYNAEATLPRTLKSVESQTFGWNIQHIIIDGASSDSTVTLAEAYRQNNPGRNIIIQSEPDAGLYDALNKGLRLAQGTFVCFLNAGDTFHDEYTLENIFDDLDTSGIGIIYGDTNIVDNEGHFLHRRRLTPPEHLTWKSFRQGMLVCHQSFIPRRQLCPQYDLGYRFSSDFDWCIRVMKECEAQSLANLFIPSPVTDYLNEGLTTANHKASLKERFRIMTNHYGLISTILYHLWFVARLILHCK